jgi:putative nucleotidyltransferase with HDIG domain
MDVSALLERLDELPPLPAVAAKVLALAEDQRTSAIDLAHVLSTDQALTAKLIRISNSAFYGFARRVSTVREAVVVLGFRQVRQVALGMSMMSAFRLPTRLASVFDLDLFWGHSVAVAVAAEAIAKRTRAARPEDAFTAGILHDIGRLGFCVLEPEGMREAVELARDAHIPLWVAEAEVLGIDHRDFGAAIGRKWKFPGFLLEALARHHDEALTPERDGLAGAVAQANRLVLHYGLFCGYETDGAAPPPLPADLERYEAMAGGIERVLERAFAFIESASGTPNRWYQPLSA